MQNLKTNPEITPPEARWSPSGDCPPQLCSLKLKQGKKHGSVSFSHLPILQNRHNLKNLTEKNRSINSVS